MWVAKARSLIWASWLIPHVRVLRHKAEWDLVSTSGTASGTHKSGKKTGNNIIASHLYGECFSVC